MGDGLAPLKGAVVLTSNAGEVYVHEGSQFADYLERHQVHDPGVEHFMRKHRERLHPFFDVGAHVGVFSIIAGRTGKVIAFEPDPHNRHLLAANLKHHGIEATVYPTAVADRDRILRMAPMPCGLSEKAGRLSGEPIHIEARSISSVVEETGVVPSFVKIDVEGAEHLVLQGMHDSTLAKTIVELEFSWRDHGRRLDEFTQIRPLDCYDWTILLTKAEASEIAGEMQEVDCGRFSLFEKTMSSQDDVKMVMAALERSTAERHSRKWEVCITPRVCRDV